MAYNSIPYEWAPDTRKVFQQHSGIFYRRRKPVASPKNSTHCLLVQAGSGPGRRAGLVNRKPVPAQGKGARQDVESSVRMHSVEIGLSTLVDIRTTRRMGCPRTQLCRLHHAQWSRCEIAPLCAASRTAAMHAALVLTAVIPYSAILQVNSGLPATSPQIAMGLPACAATVASSCISRQITVLCSC
jgi:hypothetical protein